MEGSPRHTLRLAERHLMTSGPHCPSIFNHEQNIMIEPVMPSALLATTGRGSGSKFRVQEGWGPPGSPAALGDGPDGPPQASALREHVRRQQSQPRRRPRRLQLPQVVALHVLHAHRLRRRVLQ